MIELLHMDCMEYMRSCPDKAFDLAIVDPPYGIKIGGESGKVGGDKPFGKRGFEFKGKNKCVNSTVYRVFDDTKTPDFNYFNELKRVSKNQIIWGGNYFKEYLQNTSCMLIWDKDNSGNFADCEIAWTSFKTSVRMFTHRWNGMLQHDMSQKEIRFHPTQKPIRLYKWLLKSYARPGDKIFDSHGGSMSSAIACHQMGFDLVLTEIDKDYYDAGVKRFNNAKMQQTLFDYK